MPTYNASCHCHFVRVSFETTQDLYDQDLVLCNCSICTKNGYINVYARNERVKILRGEDQLKGYSFLPHTLKHEFCSHCGSNIIVRVIRKESPHYGRIGINIRMVNDIDLKRLKFTEFDGAAKEPSYAIQQ